MMNDLISRQDAIDAVYKCADIFAGDMPVMVVKADAYEALAQLPSAQPEKRTEKRTETHACDCISRQAAIDAILAVTGNSSVRELYEHVQEHGLSDMWSGGVNAAIDIIIAVPSAQPETHEERTETHACDCIDRQAAIAIAKDLLIHLEEYHQYNQAINNYCAEIIKLPSAQPEIIHCNDCKHKGTKNCVANAWTTILGVMVNDDFYCGLAERRTDD